MTTKTNNPGCVGFLFFGLFAVVGTLMTIAIVVESRSGPTHEGWPTTVATILHTDISAANGVFGPYSPQIDYEYIVDGRTYRSEKFAQHDVNEDNYYDILKLLDAYPVGSTTTCFYDPQAPRTAVLNGEPPTPLAMALFSLIFVAVGVGGLVMTFHARRHRDTPGGTHAARSLNRAKPTTGPVVACIIFSVFAVVGLVLVLALSKPAIEEMIAARSWTEVEATIIGARVRSHRGDDSTTYSVEAVYDYVVDGKQYRSNRFDLIGGSSSGRASKEQRVNAMPPGTRMPAYVDPSDPARAVLDRSVGWTILLPMIPVVFLLIGFIGSTFAFRALRRARRGTDDETGNPHGIRDPNYGRNTRAPQSPAAAQVRSTPVSGGGVELSPSGRILPLVLISIFALIWNGFTWPFFLSSLGSDTCGTIFMIPFLLVGVALGGAVLYTGLSIFNPRTTITLEPGTPRLGEPLKLSFVLSGRVDRVDKLRIVLEGIESATYRRGTKTTTDTSTFRRILLFETDQQFMMERGSITALLPIDTMPSLKAGSSEFKWQIKVSGSIRRWPDLSDTFAITIAPAPIGGRGADWLR